MAVQNSILTTSNLSIGYTKKSEKKVVGQNVNLDFKQGNMYSIVGANGIGKSTLLRTLAGIQKPLLGTVFLNGNDIATLDSVSVAQNLSLVLTEKLPPNNLTVFEIIALGRQPYTNWLGTLNNHDLQSINQAVQLTEIDSLLHKKHYEISDGQMQKVLIARALAQDTTLIILDEPTTHLDLLNKVSVFKLLKKLANKTQKCILFSTHDIDLAIQLSDKMVVMTPNFVIEDEPFQLISHGIFDTLFTDKSIVFDKQKGKFIVE